MIILIPNLLDNTVNFFLQKNLTTLLCLLKNVFLEIDLVNSSIGICKVSNAFLKALLCSNLYSINLDWDIVFYT